MPGTGARLIGGLAAACLLLAGCGSKEREVSTTSYSVPSSGTLRVVAVGDIACAPGAAVTAKECQQWATARLAASLKPGLVLTLGDHQYDAGSPQEFYSYSDTWGMLRSITRPAIGNHEYVTRGASGFFEYFKGRTPGPPG